MKELALTCILVVCVGVYAVIRQVYRQSVRKRIPHKEIVHINTLLQNVEKYDGTARGQKRIGGAKR